MLSQGKVDEAISSISEASRLDPRNEISYNNLGGALAAQGKVEEAIVQYREALRLRPGWPVPANRLAWIFATNENPKFRNGVEAIRLAEMAARATRNQEPGVLDTLAAAYAETERFEEAVSTAEQAIGVASSANLMNFADQIRKRLLLYQNRRPFRTSR